jgi:uncharacterized membrane protein YGL010W
MKSIQTWFDEYGVSHKNPINKLIHWVCVPLIFFSIIGLLASIPSQFLKELFPTHLKPFIHFGTILIALGLLFYMRLSVSMSVGILAFSICCLFGVVWIENSELTLWVTSLTIFALAWIGQFIGHKIEGAKPSFLEDLQFLMIGPAWLMGFIYKKLGIPY